jgi:hypothetical protein
VDKKTLGESDTCKGVSFVARQQHRHEAGAAGLQVERVRDRALWKSGPGQGQA